MEKEKEAIVLPDRIDALMHLPHAVLFWDALRRCKAANSNGSDNFTALRADFLIGLELAKLPAKHAAIDNWNKHFDLAQSKKLPVEFVETHSVNGQQLELQTTIIPEYDERENLIGFSTITIHAANKLESKQLSQAWNSMFMHSSDVVMALDLDMRIRNINNDWLERSADWFLGLNFLNFIDDADRETFVSLLPRIQSKFETFRLETKISLTENNWYNIQVCPWVENDALTSIIVVLKDISESKRAEQAKSAVSDLLMSAFKTSDEASVLLRLNGAVIIANDKAEELFGLKFSHIDQLHVVFFDRLQSIEDETKLDVKKLKVFSAVESKKSARQRFALRQNNAWIPYESTIQLVNADEESSNLIWTLKNIQNDVVRFERLKKINDKLDSFVQTTAHDIKAPVSNIHNLSLLLQKAIDEQTKMVVTDKLVAATNQLSEQVKELLDLSETRRNKKIQTEDLDLRTELNRVLVGFESLMQARDVAVFADFTKAPTLHFNRAFLASILNNLLGNAIKYASPKRDSVVSLTSRPADNGLWLEISDNGIGIDLIKHGKDLFQPYKRLTNEGNGKGLGLSFVKDFVDKVGGEILVESTPDIGTTFNVLLHNMNPNLSQYSLFDELNLQDS
jgi:signal transduction histidine kinase